jgi:hypothetical protein
MAHDGVSEAIPWDRTPFPGWLQTVGSWPWKSFGDGEWEKSGSCPRCKHDMSVMQAGGVVFVESLEQAHEALLADENAGPFHLRSTSSANFYARCNCGEPHPGRPANLKRGCGQAGSIEPPPDEG